MFDNTVTFTVGGADKVLTRINQDGYSSEYLLRESTASFRLNIRNTSYSDKKGGTKTDRHNVEFIHTVFPTEADPQTRTYKQYFVFELGDMSVQATSKNSALALAGFLTEANLLKLLAWES